MYNEFGGTLSNLALAKHRKSRAINAENPRGEKGKGGMAASDLGPSRKGSPCLNDIASGQTVTLAEIEGPGAINHIWITVDAKTTDADCFVLRDLVLRMYWHYNLRIQGGLFLLSLYVGGGFEIILCCHV